MRCLRNPALFTLTLLIFGVLAINCFGQANEVKATFVELGSVNCVPCKMMQTVMKEVEDEYGDQVKVIFYDVWTKEGAPYGKQYKIQAIPTQVFLDKDGKEFSRHLGFFPKEEIEKVFDKQGVKPVKISAKTAAKPGNADTKLQTGAVCR
jgi:thioredoxin 1